MGLFVGNEETVMTTIIMTAEGLDEVALMEKKSRQLERP
jgi:hypothetical protein